MSQQLLLSYGNFQAIQTPVSIGSTTVGNIGISTLSITTSAIATSGSIIYITAGAGGQGANLISSISDGVNTYSQAVNSAHSLNDNLWSSGRLVSNLASGSTITVTFGANIIAEGFAAACYANGTQALAADKTAEAGVVGTSPSVATGTLAQANEIVFGSMWGYTVGAPSTITTGSGFTQISTATGFGSDICSYDFAYKIANSTTTITYAPTGSVAFAGTGCILVASFKGN